VALVRRSRACGIHAAISRGEFHERAPVRGAAEISELAETFNNMAAISKVISRASSRLRRKIGELFLGSIRMLAAAIDEKGSLHTRPFRPRG